jgi:hypothetical protein
MGWFRNWLTHSFNLKVVYLTHKGKEPVTFTPQDLVHMSKSDPLVFIRTKFECFPSQSSGGGQRGTLKSRACGGGSH